MEKVIVTQDITRNYLLEKQFVQEDKIKDVFGVVILLDKINGEYNEKLHYGIDKQTLDICFVAHRYTAIGQDKGYDIFIEAAKELSKKYNFVRFHVVGPWDESILDVSEIKNITFYGSRGQEWFDTFYKDKDIILSPNINGVISTGSFDGFPTGCVTDAALRKTAMLLTDPLSLNNGRFKEGEEIVVIRHDVKDILDKIEYYISEPEQLKKLCENGYKRVKEMYGYDLQIAPRINLLTDALKNAKNKRNRALLKHKLGVIYRRFVPSFIKNIYKKLKKTVKG
jgi:glycosyltransferase involved in cell wall biosynthesis